MKKRRILCILLAALLILSMVACGEKEESKTDTTETIPETVADTDTETEGAVESQPALPEKDFEGISFTFLRYDLTEQGITYLANDLCPEGENGDTLNDALWRRNAAIEEKYNVHFAEVRNTNVVAALEQMLQAGDTAYDAANPDLLRLRSLTLNGSLMNLYDLPYMDRNDPWWDAASVEALTVCGKLPAVFCDITLMDKYSTYVTLFHKGMAEDYGLPDLYTLTAEGKWTLDTMITFAQSVSQDKNGDGVYDQNDVYGVAAQNDAMYVLLHGCGAHLADTNENGDPADTFYSDRTVAIVQEILSLMTDSQRFFNRQSFGLDVAGCIQMFASNQVLFFQRPLYTVEALRDMENDYGIIPIPKYAETDEKYQCTLNKWLACPIAVPLVVEDTERTGIILTALAAEAQNAVLPSFYENVLGAKIVRDAESAAMLDLIFASRMYDIGYIFNYGAFCDKLMTLAGGKNQNIASLYEANKDAIAADIDAFIDKVR